MTEPAATSPRLAAAFEFAEQIHRGQTRKKTLAPALSHLMAVASLVMENDGNEDEAIAALLHDGPEDCEGARTLAEIEHRFGDRVAQIVLGCTDSIEDPKPSWQERKSGYIAHLVSADPSILLVSLADKVHNVRSLVVEYRQVGEQLWERFSASRDQSLWYYESLLEVFRATGDSRCAVLVDELSRCLDELRKMIAEGQS